MLGFGLNQRKPSSSSTAGKGRSSAMSDSNVFGDDDDDDEEDMSETINGGRGRMDSRQRVNQSILKEQEAVRQRAIAAAAEAAASSSVSNIYDYDGAYDSFSKNKDYNDKGSKDGEEQQEQQQPRKSRYISYLLETSKKRQLEREAVMERKIAKEQAIEDSQEDFVGKDKFITKAYRRKLEERQQWQTEQSMKEQEEEANDVTKQTNKGTAMAKFYGNFSNNIAVGGGSRNNDDGGSGGAGIVTTEKKKEVDEEDFRGDGSRSFLSGFERSSEKEATTTTDHLGLSSRTTTTTTKVQSDPQSQQQEKQTMTPRQYREHKVAAARIRYLERRKAIAMSFEQ